MKILLICSLLWYAVSLVFGQLCDNGSDTCLNNPNNVELFVEKRTRTHPLIHFLHEPSTAMAAKFRSLSGRNIVVYWDDGADGVEQAFLSPGMITTTNTYEGHSFYATPEDDKSKVLNRFTISKEKVFYTIEDPEVPGDTETVQEVLREEKFLSEYLSKTGIAWRHYYGSDGPRPPPVLFMWPTKEVGDVHKLTSHNGYWSCNGAKDNCQSKSPLNFTVECVALEPRVFMIDNFLSDYEADQIIADARPNLGESIVGDEEAGGIRKSNTRTSLNTWLKREKSPMYDTLYRRAADVLNLDEGILWSHRNAEDIQVVHYINGQKYDSHHDWGDAGYHESRFLTLLLYLSELDVGGETSFPKAAGGGIKVKPKKGQALLFYDLLPDGNGDDLSVHAALPAISGEKWLANFWVWDPKRRD